MWQKMRTGCNEDVQIIWQLSKCANNIDSTSPFHVSDSQHDILNKESGNLYLDYNNDDYYNHSIDGCLDLKNSKYLVKNN